MRMRALIAQLAAATTAPTIDATMSAATMTTVTIKTGTVISQKDPSLVKIVTAINEPRAKHNYDEQYKKILDGPCPLHKNAKHKMKDCLSLAKKF